MPRRSPDEPTIDRRGDTLIVEADSHAEAVDTISQYFGERYEFVGAERVRRGGWRGWFARERLQVTVTLPQDDPPAPSPAKSEEDTEPAGGPVSTAAPAAGYEGLRGGASTVPVRPSPAEASTASEALSHAVDAVAGDEDSGLSFRDELRRQLNSAPRAVRDELSSGPAADEEAADRPDEQAEEDDGDEGGGEAPPADDGGDGGGGPPRDPDTPDPAPEPAGSPEPKSEEASPASGVRDFGAAERARESPPVDEAAPAAPAAQDPGDEGGSEPPGAVGVEDVAPPASDGQAAALAASVIHADEPTEHNLTPAAEAALGPALAAAAQDTAAEHEPSLHEHLAGQGAPAVRWRPPDAERFPSTPEWDLDRLEHLGVPPRLKEFLPWPEDGRQDGAWLQLIATVFTPVCRPLPARPVLLVGPHADRVGAALGLPVVTFPEDPPEGESAAVKMTGASSNREWLRRHTKERWLHVVVGGDRWEGLILEEPTAVSWSTAASFPAAVDVALRFGVTLGYAAEDSKPTRPGPWDLAFRMRGQMPQPAVEAPEVAALDA